MNESLESDSEEELDSDAEVIFFKSFESKA